MSVFRRQTTATKMLRVQILLEVLLVSAIPVILAPALVLVDLILLVK